MKKLYFNFIFCLFAGMPFEAAAQIYVNKAATGMNNGSSWEHAFTDLQDALMNANSEDEVWVAAGNYLPGDNPEATFLIDKNLMLLGGFAGYESSPNERDITANETILSGDILGDDIDGEFDIYRSDNSIHVIMAPDTSISWAIDGFTISGGTARYGTSPSGADLSQRGGGILSFASCTIRNCIFRYNSAAFGGAGCSASLVEEVSLENCIFENNTGHRGAGCFFARVVSTKVADCQFTDNYASLGGAVYVGNTNCTFRDCNFTGNVAAGRTGGLYIFTHPLDNPAPNPLMVLKNCTFSGNRGSGRGGLGVDNLIPGSRLVVEDCIFEYNQGTNSDSYGGGMSVDNEGTLEVSISGTRFEGNSAFWSGGLDLYNYDNGQYLLDMDSCEFIGNFAEKDGGGIGIYSEDEAAVQADLSNLYFLYNASTFNGGGIAITNSSTDTLQFSLTDSWFENNTSSGWGGGLSLVDIGATVLERCTFWENSSLTHGAGIYRSGGEGAVLLDNVALWSNDGLSSIYNDGILTLRNVTLYGNSSGLWQTGNAELILQNTILADDGMNYQSDGSASVITRGGNLSDDTSLESALTGTGPHGFADLNNTVPLLDAGLMPTPGSPCVDAGNLEGIAPDAADLAGNPRIQGYDIDIGAYESPFIVVGMEESTGSEVNFFPNPASKFLRIQLPENKSAPFTLRLFDAQGKLVQQQMIRKDESLNVEELPKGMYCVKASVEGAVYSGRFVRM